MHPRALALAVSLLVLTACDDTSPPAGSSPTAASPPPTSGSATDRWLADVDLAAYMDCARERDVTLLQAHRAGDRPGAAENSLKAIEASIKDGAVFAELDVARTADGVLVLMHDDTVDRTTTGSGTLGAMAHADVATLELVDATGRPTGETVPTLAAALDRLDGRGVAQIDLKDIDVDTIATALERAGAVDRSVIITYTMDDALALHDRLPGVMLSVGIRDTADLDTLRANDVDLSRVTAWLGLGSGDRTLDSDLAKAGLETSYGDFRAERDGRIDYAAMAANGAEVLSVDDVVAAAAALDAASAARGLLDACGAARG